MGFEFVDGLVAKLRAYDVADLKAALTEFGHETSELTDETVAHRLAGRLVRIVREAIGVSPRFSRPGRIVLGRVFLGLMPRDHMALPLHPREAAISDMPTLQIVELWGRQDERGRPLMVSAIHMANGAEHERYLAMGTTTDDPHLTEAQRRLRYYKAAH